LLKNVVTTVLLYHWKDLKKFFDKVSEKFDLVRNWAAVGELMSLPVAIYYLAYN